VKAAVAGVLECNVAAIEKDTMHFDKVIGEHDVLEHLSICRGSIDKRDQRCGPYCLLMRITYRYVKNR
jgi:hypothetical protein